MPILSTYESGLWKSYFGLLDTLRAYTVWKHEEDGELRADGWRQKPPRFIAVVEDQATFAHLQARAAEVAALPTKWPIQMFDEGWGWGRVQVNDASASKRYPMGEVINLGPVEKNQDAAAREVVAALLVAGHQARLVKEKEGQHLEVTVGPGGLTTRWSSGRAFRLRAWSPAGDQLHDKLSVGAVICRGVLRGIEDGSGSPRKTRADKLQKIATWGEFSLYQPAGKRPASTVKGAPSEPQFPLLDDYEADPSPLAILRLGQPRERLSLTPHQQMILSTLKEGGRLEQYGQKWKLYPAGRGGPQTVKRAEVEALRTAGYLI